MMRIFLTGGNGMLGRAMQRIADVSFPNLNIIAPTRTELPLHDKAAVDAFYAKHEFDMVIHAAAKVGGIAANIAAPVDFLTDNLRINDNVIMGAHDAGIADLLFFGSSCMYPKNYRQPLLESDLLAAPLEPTNEGYALSKITAAKLCEYIDGNDERNYKTIVPCNLFGTEDHFGSDASHLLAAVVTKIVAAKRANDKSVTIWGTGNARREFLFVDDLVTFILNNLGKISAFPNYMNVGYGTDVSIDEYYKIVADIVNYQGTFKYDTERPEGMMQKLMDSSIAAQKFDWAAATPMIEAIQKVVDAYEMQSGADT
jgi:GDP-L-fucose synthase